MFLSYFHTDINTLFKKGVLNIFSMITGTPLLVMDSVQPTDGD
jgi:hypothetical protein